MLGNGWFYTRYPRMRPAGRLFCFPFAGGGCGTYLDWPRYLDQRLEVLCVQLPGRGNRFRQPPFTSIQPLVEALAPSLEHLTDMPFAFFGHSMGSLIAYELACYLLKVGAPQPRRIYVSGTEAPPLIREDRATSLLPDEELVGLLRRMNGMPDEILRDSELLDLVLPVIRADFALTGTYKYTDCVLNCGIIAFCGTEDHEAPPNLMGEWAQRTTDPFRMHTVPGDHFFINSSREQVLEIVGRDLMEWLQI